MEAIRSEQQVRKEDFIKNGPGVGGLSRNLAMSRLWPRLLLSLSGGTVCVEKGDGGNGGAPCPAVQSQGRREVQGLP